MVLMEEFNFYMLINVSQQINTSSPQHACICQGILTEIPEQNEHIDTDSCLYLDFNFRCDEQFVAEFNSPFCFIIAIDFD